MYEGDRSEQIPCHSGAYILGQTDRKLKVKQRQKYMKGVKQLKIL